MSVITNVSDLLKGTVRTRPRHPTLTTNLSPNGLSLHYQQHHMFKEEDTNVKYKESKILGRRK